MIAHRMRCYVPRRRRRPRSHPPLIVRDEEKGRYYAVLQQYDEAEDVAPLYEFFRYETEKRG